MIDVYEELRFDLLQFITPEQAQQVVSWLANETLIDYDTLKEYYLDEEEDEGIVN